VWIASLCGVIAVAALLHWGWQLDPPPLPGRADIGGGLRLPTYVSGPVSQAWWAMVVLMMVSASLYGCLLFSYLYLWLVSPQTWPAALPALAWPAAGAALLLGSSAAVAWADRKLTRLGDCRALWLALPLLAAGFAASLAAQSSVSPTRNAYGAIVYAFLSVDGWFVAVAIVLALFALARHRAGKLDAVRRVTFDNAKLFWHYTVAQTLAGLAMVHGFPRLVG
jgi:heme/copper-type cytochrome/quinol oxidase subunit 3